LNLNWTIDYFLQRKFFQGFSIFVIVVVSVNKITVDPFPFSIYTDKSMSVKKNRSSQSCNKEQSIFRLERIIDFIRWQTIEIIVFFFSVILRKYRKRKKNQ